MKIIHVGQRSWALTLNSWIYALRRHFFSGIRHMTLRRAWNACLVLAELLLRKQVLRGRPLAIKIDPTNICNFHCPGCITGAGEYPGPQGKLDYHLYRKIVDQVSEHAFKMVLYMWGEPLVNRSIFEFIEYAAKKNMAVQISTNMTLLRPEFGEAEKLVASGLDTLVVSLDGTTQETYEVYRVGGKFQKVVDNTRAVVEAKEKLKSRFPFIEMQFIVFPHNRHQVEDMKTLAARLGVDRLTFINAHERTADYLARQKAAGKHPTPETCQALWMFSCVQWNGVVSPCCDSVDDSFGDLRTSSFKEIWNSARYRKARALQHGQRYNGHAVSVKCERCEIYNGRPVFQPQENGAKEPTPTQRWAQSVWNNEGPQKAKEAGAPRR